MWLANCRMQVSEEHVSRKHSVVPCFVLLVQFSRSARLAAVGPMAPPEQGGGGGGVNCV